MSYCRFSCDNFGSDIYAYEGERGIHIHVAKYRLAAPVPPIELVNHTPTLASVRAQHAHLQTAQREPIGLMYDGESFLIHTPETAVDFLSGLAAMGYRVPQHAFDELRAEIDVGEGECGAI